MNKVPDIWSHISEDWHRSQSLAEDLKKIKFWNEYLWLIVWVMTYLVH